jgi:hypothetical protein
MLVSANLANDNSWDWTDEPCKQEDILFKSSIGGKFSNVNCVTINHISPYLNNPGGQSALAYALWKGQGVEVPKAVLQIAITRYSSNGRVLRVQLNINPEIAGFQPPTELDWGRSPWHFSQAFKDPAKKRFIDALSAWALLFAKQVDVAIAYDKKADAFALVPSWRTVIDQKFEADAPKMKVTLD